MTVTVTGTDCDSASGFVMKYALKTWKKESRPLEPPSGGWGWEKGLQGLPPPQINFLGALDAQNPLGAAVSVASSGIPHQSQDLQTRSCGLVAQPQPRESCLRWCTPACVSLTPWHIVGPAVAAALRRASVPSVRSMN